MFPRRLLLMSAGLVCLSYSPSAATEPPPQFLTQWNTCGAGSYLQLPWGVAIDPQGYVYVADQYGNRICKFTDTGQLVLSWGSSGTGPGQFNLPAGVDADQAGHIFVTDYYNNRVQVFTSEGVFIGQIGSGGNGPGQLSGPYDVAADGSGRVYVADHGNRRVSVFDVSGSFIRLIGESTELSGPLLRPSGVAVDAVGNIYVSDEGGGQRSSDYVAKFDPAGNLLLTFGGQGTAPGMFSGPAGLCVDPQGNIFVTDFHNARVQKFDAGGTLLSHWAYGEDEFGPLDVTMGPNGSIYVTGDGYVRKYGYVPVSTLVATWGSVKARYRGAPGAGQPSQPAR
jgi:tripartite motif-containing protein 71